MPFGLSVKNFGDSQGPIFLLLYGNCILGNLVCFFLLFAVKSVSHPWKNRAFTAPHRCVPYPQLCLLFPFFFLLLCFTFPVLLLPMHVCKLSLIHLGEDKASEK